MQKALILTNLGRFCGLYAKLVFIMRAKRIIAIGDSFFYLCDHLDETGYRLNKGILGRVQDELPFPTEVINLGKNGSKTSDWIKDVFPAGDIYLILLGTNDWWGGTNGIGTARDYLFRSEGTILGNLGIVVSHIKMAAPGAKIFLCNPIERGDFVYLLDYSNFAKGSYEPHHGIELKQISDAIFYQARESGVVNVNTHDLCGISCYNAVKFKRCLIDGKVLDLPYPNYTAIPFDPEDELYPYPPDAIDMTYDGLHPSDKGSQAIAEVIARAIAESL